MLTVGFTREQIQTAAKQAGVTLVDFRAAGKSRQGEPKYKFRLGLIGEQWRRLGHSGRRVSAVCWHGHKSFMQALFAQNAEGRIETSMAKYRGMIDFQRSFAATGDRNIGSMYHPMSYKRACVCS